MKNLLGLKALFGYLLLMATVAAIISFWTTDPIQITFRLKITEIAHPDSVAVYLYLSPLQKGATTASSSKGPYAMSPPDAQGLYQVTLTFPDSVSGKTLFYRYQSGRRIPDIWRRVTLDKNQPQLLLDNWGMPTAWRVKSNRIG